MRPWIKILAAAAIPACVLIAGQPDAESAPPPAVEEMIRNLGDNSFRVREEATRKLWELGDGALAALEEAAASPDPERSFRARELLRKIQLHITPDTDPSVIDLVERYAGASPAEKTSLLGKMRGKRAWYQMLKLHADEKDPDLRERLVPTMKSVAQRAARESLLKGEIEKAREFLELAPADSEGLLALAEFHRSQGTLEMELERAAAMRDRQGAAWRLALLRASGDPEAARRAAIEAGEKHVAASMAALTGDPLPWLALIDENTNATGVQRHYAQISAKRWRGNPVRQADLGRLTRLLNSRDPSESGAALNALFLLGEVAVAEPAFVKSQALAGFRHYEMLERIPEAFGAFGIDPENPDFAAWVTHRLATSIDEDEGDIHDLPDSESEIIALANFLERRGLHAEAHEAFAAPLAQMAEKDVNSFTDYLSRMLTGIGGAPRLARSVGLAWAGDDDDRWQEFLIAAFGEDERFNAWWQWLERIEPEAERVVRMDTMFALFDLIPDVDGIRKEWLARLWESVENAAEREKIRSLELMSELFAEVGDVENGLKAWDLSPPESRDKVFWGHTLLQLSAAERWNDAVELIRKQIDAIVEAGHEPGADLHSYAAAALRAAGREEEALIHDSWVDQLALGSASVAMRVGNGYAYGGDSRRAAEWWFRAAMQADPMGDEFSLAMRFHSDLLIDDGDWVPAASISEVLAALYAGSDYLLSNQLPLMRVRLQADTARAMSRLDKDRSGSLSLLADCHRVFATDGSLADFFFPALRKAGLVKQHDEWFLASWRHFQEVIGNFPDSDNTLNTAAWFATRAVRELETAEEYIRKAVALNPRQAAYLDTMAEWYFAKGRRAEAMEWSQRAVNASPEDTMIRRQHERFRNAPFPE